MRIKQFSEARDLHAGIGIRLWIETRLAPKGIDRDRIRLQRFTAPGKRFRYQKSQQTPHDWRSLKSGISLDRIEFCFHSAPERPLRLDGVVVHLKTSLPLWFIF